MHTVKDIDTSELSELYKISSIEEIKQVYQALSEKEENINQELEHLYDNKAHVETQLSNLIRSFPKLELVNSDAHQLSNLVTFTSDLAENISSKVKRLDTAKSRANECMQRVGDILDLKFCTDGVTKALDNEDYEKAAAHIHRYLSLDQIGLKKSAADTNEDSNLEEAFSKLNVAETKLKEIVMCKFDEAVRDEDLASVERFFKIFPLLNQHTEGLKKFSTYLCSKVADMAQKNLKSAQVTPQTDKRANIIYADVVTLLFEFIARMIEVHQPLVETYYGPGKLLSVIERLQKECDRQVKKLLDEFKSNRLFHRKTLEVTNSYKSIERLDPIELDILLGEITLINARTELYIGFIRRHVLTDIDIAANDEVSAKVQKERLDFLIKNSQLSLIMQELLGSYIMMEEYFLRESINKAIQMDVVEDKALTSTMLDDVFFIIKKCLRRCLTSSSIDGMCAMLNHTCTSLQGKFCAALNEKLRQNIPSSYLDLSKLQSKLQQTQEPDQTLYLITLNNADVACEHIDTLSKALDAEISKTFAHGTDSEKAKLRSCLGDLQDSSQKFQQVRTSGMAQLCSTVIKPRIKPWAETFQSTSHHIVEEDFTQFEANDGMRPFIQSFIFNIDGMLKSFKDHLTVQNYDSLVIIIVTELTELLEKAVYKSSFNRLGGLQFDRELRALIAYLTSITTWSIRDRFARLNQIATLLNLETLNELGELWGPNSGPITWRLGPNEVRQVLYLRSDFRMEEIKKLKL